MATSILVVGQRAELFNDLDLLVLLGLILEEMEDEPGHYPSLQSRASTWADCRESSGPGTIDLDLESLVQNAQAKRDLLELLSAVTRKLDVVGPYIPADVLNSRYAVRGVRFNDYSTARLSGAMEKIQNLLLP
jgi:hypothetical protein